MRAVGLRKVAELPVPIDRWVFRGASVAVGRGPTFEASSWGGVPGTSDSGITAEVIDLGAGQAADYEGVDATGKIVLVDWAFGDFWVNRHGHQATLEGALAVIFYTGRTAAGAFYNKRDDGLLSFDGTYDDDWVPFVFVTRHAANDLIDRVAAGPTTVTLISHVELTRADDGGVGYNVLGSIPGTDRADELIIFTGHHDAWFRGAADDATAIAAMLGDRQVDQGLGLPPAAHASVPGQHQRGVRLHRRLLRVAGGLLVRRDAPASRLGPPRHPDSRLRAARHRRPGGAAADPDPRRAARARRRQAGGRPGAHPLRHPVRQHGVGQRRPLHADGSRHPGALLQHGGDAVPHPQLPHQLRRGRQRGLRLPGEEHRGRQRHLGRPRPGRPAHPRLRRAGDRGGGPDRLPRRTGRRPRAAPGRRPAGRDGAAPIGGPLPVGGRASRRPARRASSGSGPSVRWPRR